MSFLKKLLRVATALSVVCCASAFAAGDGRDGLSSQDRAFIEKAGQGGRAEVELGKIMTQKTRDPAVKEFAERLVGDHGKANDQLKALADANGISIPDGMPAEAEALKEKLMTASGDQLDSLYVDAMVADHEKDIAAFEKLVAEGQDDEIKSFANETLPTLREHLRHARSVKNSDISLRQLIDPTAEDSYWREHYAREPYYEPGFTYEDYAPAYRSGYAGRAQFAGRQFDEVERDLEQSFAKMKGSSKLAWGKAKVASRAAWDRAERAMPGDADLDGK